MTSLTLLTGDALTMLRTLPDQSVQCCVTSPPYWCQRDYQVDGQIGMEPHPADYVATLVAVFAEVRRVLRDDGTLWLNLGDTHNNRKVIRPSSHQGGLGFQSDHLATAWRDHTQMGRTRLSIEDGDLKEKDLIGVPWMVAFALRADGWYLRQHIPWIKPHHLPEHVHDRPATAVESFFLLSKSETYLYEADAVRERRDGGRDRHLQNYFIAAVSHYGDKQGAAHFATFPPALIEPFVRATTRPGDSVLDPFMGSGTTGEVALRLGRRFVGIDLKDAYVTLARERLAAVQPMLFFVQAEDEMQHRAEVDG